MTVKHLPPSKTTIVSDRGTIIQIFRYGLIGVFSNAIGYLLYLAVTFFGAPPILAMTLLYSIGAFVGFFGNRSLTFNHIGSVLGSGTRYILAHVIGYFLNLTMLLIFVDHLGYPHQLIQAAAILTVAVYLFIMFKFFVFRSAPNDR